MFWRSSCAAFILFYAELVTLGFSIRHLGQQLAARANQNASWSTPELDGCASNLWHKTCCCRVRYGILHQSLCMCASSRVACGSRIQPRTSRSPSRPFELPAGEVNRWWGKYDGFWDGYYVEANRYCSAAPIIHPQVEPREVKLTCTCSSSVGAQNKQLTCGTSCSVGNCKRLNPSAMEWAPLESGRGTCCDFSVWSAGGCDSNVAPINETHAQDIIEESLKIAESKTADRSHAFILPTSQMFVEEMQASFRTAKKKKLTTSRSGAQFFFSGDYKYILKSIHRPEYDVLVSITEPGVKPYLPGALINEYVLAFEYNNNPWIVVRNSVTPIGTALKAAGFRSYYKNQEVFDIKPFPITSDERPLLFGKHFAKEGIASWTNFMSVRKKLADDLNFLESVVSQPLVDYSLLVSVFYVNDSRNVLDHVDLPACVEGQLSTLPFYGNGQGSILICFSIIDLLMKFTWSKSPENALLLGKWSDWKGKMSLMFDCLGGPSLRERSKSECKSYDELNPKYRGVDVVVPTATIQDAKGFFGSNGFAYTENPGDVFKCCCNAEEGQCRLVDAANAKASSFFENAKGCGSLVGSGWHMHTRDAEECMLPKEQVDWLQSVSL